MSLIKAYERIERHQAARSLAPSDPNPLENSTAQGHEVARDPLADLLAVPIRKLTAPLAVASSVLGETIYLVANDHQASTVRAMGGVPYTPEEIDLLLELHEVVKSEVWAERLKLIHQAKKEFQGTLEP